MSAMLSTEHHKRHDGHEEKAHGYFTRNNQIVKIIFWAVVILVVVLLALQRFVLWRMRKQSVQSTQPSTDHSGVRKGRWSTISSQNPTRTISMLRWLGYPRRTFVGRYTRYITCPSRGETMFLMLYWAMLMVLLWTNVVFKSPSEMFGIRWEVVGFRAAWVSTTQLPLLYCTGCRINPISLITGISHERMNWFHRWVARTIFMTLIVHWAFFYREWDIAHFIRQEFEMMPMVIWGFAAWAAMGVMVVTGFALFRAWSYELWIVTHIIMAYAVLLLSYTHTHCTTYFVEASLGFMAFDVLGRLWLYSTKNIHFLRRGTGWLPAFGHHAELEVLDHEYLRVSVINPGFDWLPGQHVYLNVPHIRALESHPFTIASVANSDSSLSSASRTSADSKMILIIKSHAGFTKALFQSALGAEIASLRALIQGPYGNPPSTNHYDTVVFVASGNRASFTVPLLQHLSSNPGRVSRISFHLVIPDEQVICWYEPQLLQSINSATEHNIELEIIVHITKHTSKSHQIRLDDVEMWPDDNYSIGRSSSESSRSSASTYLPVSGDREVESSRLMANSGSANQVNEKHNSGLMRMSAAAHVNHSSSSSAVDQEKTYASLATQEPQEEEKAALLSNVGTAEDEKNDVTKNSAKEASQTIELHQSLRKPLMGSISKAEKLPSCMKISSGRPQVSALIMPAIQHSPDHGQVMVVAATASSLLSDITNFVARTSYEVGLGRQLTLVGGKLGGIELWSERNGD